MEQQSIEQDESRVEAFETRHGGSPWFLWLLAVIPMYAFSVGPAVRVHKAFPAARPTIEAMYSPLEYLDRRYRPAHTFFTWYIEKVWQVR